MICLTVTFVCTSIHFVLHLLQQTTKDTVKLLLPVFFHTCSSYIVIWLKYSKSKSLAHKNPIRVGNAFWHKKGGLGILVPCTTFATSDYDGFLTNLHDLKAQVPGIWYQNLGFQLCCHFVLLQAPPGAKNRGPCYVVVLNIWQKPVPLFTCTLLKNKHLISTIWTFTWFFCSDMTYSDFPWHWYCLQSWKTCKWSRTSFCCTHFFSCDFCTRNATFHLWQRDF